VALARDDLAASPMVVITTFIVIAVLLTVVVYALVFDRPENEVALVVVREEGSLAFDVAKSSGGLGWDEVDLRFLDRSGKDLSDSYLELPDGAIDPKDRVDVVPLPPAGTYLLLVFLGDAELSRLAVTV
jgi:hypothetical protein